MGLKWNQTTEHTHTHSTPPLSWYVSLTCYWQSDPSMTLASSPYVYNINSCSGTGLLTASYSQLAMVYKVSQQKSLTVHVCVSGECLTKFSINGN